MKKVCIIILSIIAVFTVSGILTYNFIYLRSFNNYKKDTDTGIYSGVGLSYDNGTLSAYNPQSKSWEVFTENSKTINKKSTN